MSAFRVFGVSYADCKRQAERVIKVRDREGNLIPPDVYHDRVLSLAAKLFEKTEKQKPVSNKYDAPQFCREFIELAPRDKFKFLAVYAYTKTDEINKKTQKPIYRWTPYVG